MKKTIKRKAIYDCFVAIENSNKKTGTITVKTVDGEFYDYFVGIESGDEKTDVITVKTVDEVPVKAKFFKTQWEDFPIVIVFDHGIYVENWVGPGIACRKDSFVSKFWKYTGIVHPVLMGTSEMYWFGLAADEVPDEYWLDRMERFDTDYTDQYMTYTKGTIVPLPGDKYNAIEESDQCPEYGDMCFTETALLVQIGGRSLLTHSCYADSVWTFYKPNKWECFYAFLYETEIQNG